MRVFRKYLVTGATGFLGRAVVQRLTEKNASVTALVIENDPLASELPDSVKRVTGDVAILHSLMPFFSEADSETCVIHCAGIVSVASRPDAAIYRVNVEGTSNIVRLCEHTGVGKLVYVSSVHAISQSPQHTLITEESPGFLTGTVTGEYAKSKALATRLVLGAAKQGLNASVVFPSGIIGPGDAGGGSITRMLTAYLNGKLPFAVKGGYDFVDVRDVARGVIDCAHRGAPGGGYILCGHYATIRSLLETAQRTLTVKRKVRYLPLRAARAVAPLAERLCLLRKKPAFFTPYAISVLGSSARFSCKKAAQAFDYHPRPIENTVRDAVLYLHARNSEQKP